MTTTILTGDCRSILPTFDAGSVQCVVTSPPYFGLRDYQIPPSIWGGDPDCAHDWNTETIGTEVGRGNWSQGTNGRGEVQPGGVEAKREPIRATMTRGCCAHCGAWLGCLGLEPTVDLFVDHIVEVFRHVWRVLKDDGTLWLNLGDSYANDGKWGGSSGGKHVKALHGDTGVGRQKVSTGLKPKDLIGIPWRVAFALQADGWWLRQDIIWAKPNPMPESVTDRCTKSHEYLFLMTKSPRYYFDAKAIAEPAIQPGWVTDYTASQKANSADPNLQRTLPKGRVLVGGETRNKRSVWTITTQPTSDAHFATFPERLVEHCILAGSREGDTILDPFAGSGTTVGVANRLGRNGVAIELNPAYVPMIERKTAQQALEGLIA